MQRIIIFNDLLGRGQKLCHQYCEIARSEIGVLFIAVVVKKGSPLLLLNQKALEVLRNKNYQNMITLYWIT